MTACPVSRDWALYRRKKETVHVARTPTGWRTTRTVVPRSGTFGLIVLATLKTPAIAQVDTGTILGTVKDATGGVMPGATVTIRHEGQGFTLTGVTREDGTFIFTPIRTGAYTVEVEMQGFRKSERRGIQVKIQQQALIDVTLETGALAEEVVVTADAPSSRPAPAPSVKRSTPTPSKTCRSTAATTPPWPA